MNEGSKFNTVDTQDFSSLPDLVNRTLHQPRKLVILQGSGDGIRPRSEGNLLILLGKVFTAPNSVTQFSEHSLYYIQNDQ